MLDVCGARLARHPERWMRTPPHKEAIASAAALTFVGNLIAPRLSYRTRWATRAGPAGLSVYVAWRTALSFSIVHYLLPRLRRVAEGQQALTDALGREPTGEELVAHLKRER